MGKVKYHLCHRSVVASGEKQILFLSCIHRYYPNRAVFFWSHDSHEILAPIKLLCKAKKHSDYDIVETISDVTGEKMHTSLLLIASLILLMIPNTSAQTNTVESLAISPDSRFIVSASSNTITVWDIETCSSLSVLEGHKGIVNSVSYSPDGQHIVTGSNDKTAIIWDVSTGKKVHTLHHDGDVTVVNYSPNGNFIVTGTIDGILAIWNTNSGEKIDSFILEGRIWSAEFSPNNQSILIANGSSAVMLDVATKEIIYRVNNPDTVSLKYATFHPSGQLFATTGIQSVLAFIWDIQTGELTGKLSERLGDFYHLAYSPDGNLISGIEANAPINPEIQYNLTIRDTKTDEGVFETFHDLPIKISLFSHDNRYFVSSFGNEIKIYNTATWGIICNLNSVGIVDIKQTQNNNSKSS